MSPIETLPRTMPTPNDRTPRRLHSRTPRRALLCATVLALCLPAAAAAAGAVSPLPASDYAVRPVCAAPAPGHAGCLALRLAPRTAVARTRPLATARGAAAGMSTSAAACAQEYTACLTPTDLNGAYFPGEPPYAPASEPQTIALVDAYDDPHAEADLKVYDKEFGLPELPKCAAGAVSACFEKVNQLGETTHLPTAVGKQAEAEAGGWALEISTDVEVAHAVCRNCRILLVEADSPAYADLETAEDTAVTLGAGEVSNSWGGEEPPVDSPAFDHEGTVIAAAAGDEGYLNWTEAAEGGPGYFAGADYPASSPHVVAVGGTALTLSGGARQSETVWNDGEAYGAAGGGCSELFTAQPWQQAVADWTSVGCGSKRAVADVSADADPYTGVAVYDSVPYPEEEEGRKGTTVLDWVPIGGTSVASPIVASVFALAGGAHGVAYPAKTLYSYLGSPSLYDVTKGGNGKCDDLYTGGCSGSMEPLSPLDCGAGALICNAAPGYDGPTGVGAPNGVSAFEPDSAAEHSQRVGERTAAEKKVAEEKRAAAEKQAEEELKARKAEEARRAAEKQAEEELKTRRAEEARLAAEKKLEEEAAAAAHGGSGEGSSGNGGGEAGTSGGAGAGASQPIAGAGGLEGGELGGLPSSASAGPGGSSGATVHLSRLALTARASAVIAHGLPTLSQVAFAFTLSAPARVRVTLSRRITVHGRSRWVSAPGALTLDFAAGRTRTHLRGHGTLAPGRYRLTLTPAHGGARSIVFALR